MPQFPIIDSHINLYREADLESLAWCPSSHPLHTEQSLKEYALSVQEPDCLEGFILVEAHRKFETGSVTVNDQHAIDELRWMSTVASGHVSPEDGLEKGAGNKCLALIPFAPVPLGQVSMEKWLVTTANILGKIAFAKVRGFRYLLQDKPKGTMLEAKFIESLRWMGTHGYAFDLGIDQKDGGRWQLDEAIRMMELAHANIENDKDKITVVIGMSYLHAKSGLMLIFGVDHLCKPNLAIYNQTDPAFVAWRTTLFTLSKCKNTFVKLSGCLGQLPEALKRAPIDEVVMALQPYLAVILACFGPSRIMFGSDWPTCKIAGDGAWVKWKQVVERFCDLASLSVEQQVMLWSGTAVRAYGIKELF